MDLKAFVADMKEMCDVHRRDTTAAVFDSFKEIWGKKYL